ncbi:hypothetical protein GCM10029976_032850 [Kribbella albertanoniae]
MTTIDRGVAAVMVNQRFVVGSSRMIDNTGDNQPMIANRPTILNDDTKVPRRLIKHGFTGWQP